MQNKRYYQIVIVILVLVNIGTLGTMWFERMNRGAGPEAASEFLARELKLSASQQQEYTKLRQEHRDKMAILTEKDKDLHNRYFDLVLEDTQDQERILALADSITANRKLMEVITYTHFADIRKTLDRSQKQIFSGIFHEMLRVVLPPPPPPPASGRGEAPPPPQGQEPPR